jgi:hypothetical protein
MNQSTEAPTMKMAPAIRPSPTETSDPEEKTPSNPGKKPTENTSKRKPYCHRFFHIGQPIFLLR